MFSQELGDLLIQVITSWQVLVITGVLVLYVFLVNYVSRLYRRRRPAPSPGSGKKKKEAASKAAPPAVVDDDLGLEESTESE